MPLEPIWLFGSPYSALRLVSLFVRYGTLRLFRLRGKIAPDFRVCTNFMVEEAGLGDGTTSAWGNGEILRLGN